MYAIAIGWTVLWLAVKTVWSMMQFNSEISLLIILILLY